jgi:diguanylate cyclase (GGDEF)-like protein/PAS domain S-box-containing protein
MPEPINIPALRTDLSADSLNASYLELLHDWSLWNEATDNGLRKLISTVSAALSVERAGIWAYSADRRSLTLQQLFDRRQHRYSTGQELLQSDFPNYFNLLASGRLIDVADLLNDPRAVELQELYTKPLGVGASMDATLRVGGRIWGVLCIEHCDQPRVWNSAEKNFAQSIADLASQVISFHALRASELQLRDICDHLSAGIVRTDFDGNCIYVNRFWCELTSTHPGQAIGDGWLQAIASEDRTRVQRAVIDLAQGTDKFTMEFRLSSHGGPRWVNSQWVIERNADGFPTSVLGGCFEVTREKLSINRLREMTTLQQAILNNAAHSIITADLDGIITSFNRAATQLLGYSEDEMVGKASPAVFHDHIEIIEHAQQLSDELGELVTPDFYTFTAKAKRGLLEEREWTYVHKNGTRIPVSLSISALRDEAGAINGYLGIAADLTERKNAERALASVNEQRNWRNQVGFQLSHLQSIEAVANKAVKLLIEKSGASAISFFYAENNTFRLLAEIGIGSLHAYPPHTTHTIPANQLWRIVKPVYVEDLATSTLFKPEQLRRAKVLGTQTVALLPLRNQGEYVGAMLLEYKTPQSPLLAIEELEGFAITTEFALTRALHLEQLAYRAEHDTLTQLPNRSVLQRELTAAIAVDESLVLMLLDLDRFKEVNDTLGHHIGDKLLCEIGTRLQALLAPSGALLCRLGGDEFAVLLRRSDQQRGLAIARDLLDSMHRSYAVDGITLEIGVSIGIACFPQHGADHHALLRAADVAMYAAKKQSVGVMAYAPSFDAHSRERLRLMSELGSAIQNRELVLHYQPKILLQNALPTYGFEALVRWQHPQMGLLAPADFLPMAEISDTIHPLTREVLRQALIQQNVWREQGQPASIAVNLSVRNLLRANFFDEVQALLHSTDADPTLLELEITETSLMHDPVGAAALLEKFAALGVKIAIDDFGTGYSSLAYLRKLPLHALKIDRAFVAELTQNTQDQVIVRSIITLAHNLNLQVVAEGVEDKLTLSMLRGMGCDCVQGFLFAQPQPATAFTAWRAQAALDKRAL